MSADLTSDVVGDPPAAAEPNPQRWWILAVLCSSLTLVMVSNLSLNVALPSIADDLGADASELQWIVDAYGLVFAGLLFAAATIGDRFGRKGALQCGLVLFVVAAVAGAFAESSNQLIAVRAVMGFGATFVMPSTLSILTDVFPQEERPKAIAMWAGIAAGGSALGPPIAGLLLEHFWWGSVLLITLPISIAALVVGHFLVPKSRDPRGTRIDFVGVVLSIVAIVALVYTIIEAPHTGWGSARTLGGFVLAAVALAVFVTAERRRSQAMLDMSLFRDARFSVASIGIGLAFFAMFGTFFLLTQVFQLVHGLDPLPAGLMVLPISIAIMLTAPRRAPKLVARYGVHVAVPLGLLVVASGLLLFGFMAQLGSPYWMWVAGIPLATGMAVTMAPLTSLIMSAVPVARAGMGSAMNDAARELGGALGVAVLGSAAATVYTSQLGSTDDLADPDAEAARSSLAGALRASGRLGPDGVELADRAKQAFQDGVLVAALVAAGIALAASLIARRWLPRDLHVGGPGH